MINSNYQYQSLELKIRVGSGPSNIKSNRYGITATCIYTHSTCLLIFVYSDTIKQLAQPVRLLLKYTGTEFENKLYVQGDGEFKI